MRIRAGLLLLLLAVVVSHLGAAVTLPRVVSDNMVLQREIPVRIWGKANPGEAVTVKFRGQTASTKADNDGAWAVYLRPMQAGGPDNLVVEADNTITLRNVLVGEVWVASGQSNMEWEVRNSDNAQEEIRKANYPQIRLFEAEKVTSDIPLDDVKGEWRECSPESVQTITAVGYFFGRKLHQELKAPVGILQSSWGGTPAEAWTSMDALRADPATRFYLWRWDRVLEQYPAAKLQHDRAVAEWERKPESERGNRPREPRGPGHQHAPATLYNAMIAPIIDYNIRGAIWYQGESNAGADQAFEYRYLFPRMILNWRDKWRQGEFPFLFVQLANFETGADWPILRESQNEALRLRNTGVAVTTDIGNPTDIHPRNKQDVGLRLALWALAETYGRDLVYSGPFYRQMTVEGREATLWFDHVGGGLKAEGGSLKGFVIAGPDRVFHPANARISGNTVVVSSPKVEEPSAVRYAWHNNPENTLRNAEGLPASPFRTDRWTNGRMPE